MVVALVAVLLLLDSTAFGKLTRNRNRASSQNLRLSIYQDRLDLGGVGVEHEVFVRDVHLQVGSYNLFFYDRLALHGASTLTEGRVEPGWGLLQFGNKNSKSAPVKHQLETRAQTQSGRRWASKV